MSTSVPSIAYIPKSKTSSRFSPLRFLSRLELMWQVQRERNQLGGMDDRMLKDLGLDRGQVEAEANRSFFDLPQGRE